MEGTFTLEIMGVTWRLRRCRLVEEAFGAIDDLDFDPMMDERTEKQQKSLDRARTESHLILRRALAELRKLRKGRTIEEQIADQHKSPAHQPAPAERQFSQRFRESGLSSFCKAAASPTETKSPAPVRFVIPRFPTPQSQFVL
jgi:hypothetical protein